MVNFIKEKSKAIGKRIYIIWPTLLIIALSIVETLIFISINNYLESYFKNIDLYIVAVPILFALVIWWTSSKSIFKIQAHDYQKKLVCFKNSFVVTVFLYMIAILMKFNINSKTDKIIILLICFGVIYLSLVFLKERPHSRPNLSLDVENINESRLFNNYYINISKVFEIAMLINNKVVISVENEKTIENSESFNENLSTNINIDYLNFIKSGISFQEEYAKSNSSKNKVLENFEVKTTKSNLLDTIIKKSKEYNKDCEISPGDLFLFNEVEIELINEEQAMQTTKMLLNGAFNGSNVSSTSDDMKMDLNMSSLMNSMLKDCSYELKCSVDDFVFYIKIPMSFENDFESDYNIYDILIGKMTLVGIYRGKDSKQKYKNAFQFFTDTQNTSTTPLYSGLTRSATPESESINQEVAVGVINNQNSDYVDIIAIIKELNIK
ncbi:hypothetical protein G9F72_023870 [Clostridium estertheticum]|uniref:hypothetical protein n=1 Tax=Clostridium estertheticum TaxID=238834 RepID=UPI0013E8FAA5|nr:hypothetical protein [Clostridium estertheticum]MBZ9689338.1 hypothetical protein [Clostridium estertheticum]